ncbi:MAG: T9SS type A sorting domain-containing protein [Bacteroidia bacterium]|nr:T9SS type A sorting domain-containing protein [Bacteroidia bacterium]
MNRYIRCLVVLLFCKNIFNANAQVNYWNKLYNNQSQWDLSFAVVDLGGYYLTAGNTANLLSTDSTFYGAVWLFYVDSNGNKGSENIIRYKNRQAYKGNQHILIRTFDNNFIYYGGLGDSNNNYSMVLIKFDSLLQPLWQTIDTGSGFMEPGELLQLPDSGFLVCGFASINHLTQKDGFLSRFDQNGNHLWTKYYGDIRQDFLSSIVQSDSNHYLLSGVSDQSPFLMKVDTAGNLIWRRNFNIPNTGLYIKKSIYGEGYIAYGSRNADSYKDYYGVVARINENAEFIWKDSIRLGTHVSAFCDAIELPGGNIIAVGLTDNGGQFYPFYAGWTAKFFKNGGIMKERVFAKGSKVESWLMAIALTSDGGIVCAGYDRNDYDTLPRGQDSWVIKLDTNLCDKPDCSPDVGITSFVSQYESVIYPNPFTSEIAINFTNTSSLNVSIRIYNAQGVLINETLMEKSMQNKILSTGSFASGLYIIQVIQNGAIIKTQKMVKQP